MNEKVERLIAEAQKAFTTADHLAFVTYPLLQDPRLMLTITQNVDRALTSGMNALLHVDEYYRRISVLPLDLNARLRIFEEHTARRYHVKRETVEILKEVKGILQKHAESPVEFVRQGRLVICDDDYRIRTLDIDRLKVYLAETRKFMQRLGEVKANV